MGLDMYLNRKTHVWHARSPITKIEGGGLDAVDPSRVSEVTEQFGYWRKVNAIHRWFVENVQDGRDECQESYVSKKQLETLLDLVNQVLDNPNKAEELLPTQSGFFFGSTNYDDWYFKNLEETKVILETALQEDEANGDFYYQASW